MDHLIWGGNCYIDTPLDNMTPLMPDFGFDFNIDALYSRHQYFYKQFYPHSYIGQKSWHKAVLSKTTTVSLSGLLKLELAIDHRQTIPWGL